MALRRHGGGARWVCDMPSDETLLQYATDRQRELIEAVWAHGGQRAASRALKVSQSSISAAVSAVKAKAAIHGYSPDHDLTNPAPPGFTVRGVSTLRDKRTGQAVLQWEKTTADAEARERMLRDAASALAEELPRLRPVRPRETADSSLLNLYIVTDYHFDMRSWARETGAKWDTAVAEASLVGCMSHLIGAAPAAATAILGQLGDFLHADGIEAVTPINRNVLDRDTRFERSVELAIRALRKTIDMLLAKHRRVIVIMAEGNHDIASSVWLRQMFSAIYENEPRITVDTSPLPYYCYRHGRTMLGLHHGHLAKPAEFPEIFAAEFPVIWGGTDYRYGHAGHLHHHHSREHRGMIVTQHQTLAARDAHAARHAWRAERALTCETYCDTDGLVATAKVRPRMARKETA